MTSQLKTQFTLSIFAALLALVVSSCVLVIVSSKKADAIPEGWNAGRIIDDSVFTNSQSMDTNAIQAFLNSKVPNCDTWGSQASEFGGGTRRQWAESRGYSAPFTCLKDYSEGGKSSAQIILDASREYSINPQVLLVLLQKEQSLVTDTWPLSIQYRSATGYGCPDTAPCDSQYYGLTNQVRWASRMFRSIMNASPGWYTPYNLGNNYIQFSPDSSCGGSVVYIENRATQALYNYTPYQPNNAALNAGWGQASCGAYGNRNFFLWFSSWFGKTTGPRYAYSEVSKDFFTDSNELVKQDTMQLTKNQYFYSVIKVKNTGGSTWNKNKIFMGSSGPQDRSSKFCNLYWTNFTGCNRLTTIEEQSVAPGATGTFKTWFKAPSQFGLYREYFNLVAEGESWFVDIGSHVPMDVKDELSDTQPNLTINAKQTLKKGESITSPDYSSILTLTNRGLLELYKNQKKVWDSGQTNGYILVLQNDGNLVLYNPTYQPVWVAGQPGVTKLQLTNDGNLQLLNNASQVVWEQNNAQQITQAKTYFESGSILYRNQSIYSNTKQYRLTLQNDGNLVMYGPRGAIWSSNTPNGQFLVQQGDGNLVMYNDFGYPVWSSNRSGENVTTYIQDDGNMVSYGPRGPIWAIR